MYCINCGKELEYDFRYCPYCGLGIHSSVESKTSAEDRYFDVRDGVLVKYTGRASNISIPNTVVRIAAYAFVEERTGYKGGVEYGSNTYVTHIRVPNSVVEIEPCAFANCVSLKEVILPSSLEKIENSVFSNCRSLIDVKIPDTVTYIGHNAFGNCRGLVAKIPESVLEIEGPVYQHDGENCELVYGGMCFYSKYSSYRTKCKLNTKYEKIFQWINSGKCRFCGGKISSWNSKCKTCGQLKGY